MDDFADKLPDTWQTHGGVFIPMYQSEALWISFSGGYPCAVKIAAGKINAVSGKSWSNDLSDKPQDYAVIPDLPWLDGFNVSEDFIRQFVAMPLGEGYTAEEQVTGKAEHGGLQITVYPMKHDVYVEQFERLVGAETDFLEIPAFLSKVCDRLVVLNPIAKSLVEAQRDVHPSRVFTYRDRPVGNMYNSAWKRARLAAAKAHAKEHDEPIQWGFANLRVHDLKHTFGRRLRAAGVSLETRKVLLGHRNGDITSHYSAPEIEELLAAANRVCGVNPRKTPALTILKRKTG